MSVRLRLNELLEERGLTPYAVAKQSAGRISSSTIHRLAKQDGRVRLIDAELLDALCDLLSVQPGDLLERETRRKGR